MPNVEKRTFSLPAKHTAFINAKVSSGAYASGSEVVRAGLRALQERDAAVERWLGEQVAPVHDAMRADPAPAQPAETAFAAVRERQAAGLPDRRLAQWLRSLTTYWRRTTSTGASRPDDRLPIQAKAPAGGKSGLHGSTVPDNARRG